MLKFNRVKLVACLLVVGGLVAVSQGAARKIKAFDTYAPEPALADGMAIINYVSGQDKTLAQVILSDFTPNKQYVIIVGSVGPLAVFTNNCPYGLSACLLNNSPENTIIGGEDGSLQTNSEGNLTVHLTNNPGDGSSSLDGVAVVTLADWNNRVDNVSGVSAFGF